MTFRIVVSAFLVTVCLASSGPASARPATPSSSIWTVNTSEVLPGRLEQARRYFANGWLSLRRAALRRGFIRSYRIHVTPRIDDKNPEIVLITEYPNQTAYNNRETNFDLLFNKLKIPRAIEIDGLKRADIFGPVVGAENYSEIEASGAR